jgi:uncharacterized protein YbgA (DUF1722 family)
MTKFDKKWNMKYQQLVEFKRTNGHYLVPQKYEQDKSLGEWVNKQRKIHNDNKMRLDRKIILDEIGFTWKADATHFKPDDKLWHQQYKKLVEYKRNYGHCMVPSKYEKDKSLGKWVHAQRTHHNNNKMRQARKKILDEIGFAWKDDGADNDKLWHQQYEKLLEYKRKNGHCKVPHKYKDDKSLGKWVNNQRSRHANNKMLPDRKELLDAIDFVWKADTVTTRSSATDVRGVAI